MKKVLITELKPGDIFKLENSGIDVLRIVRTVTVKQVIYSQHTLVRVCYAFSDDDSNGMVIQTYHVWTPSKKVYKVLV